MIPLAVPNLTGHEKEYLNDCIDTTYVSSVGPYVTKLENMTAEATGASYAVATSAGTTGLHAALVAAGVKAGDLVIIPTFTFIATANAVAHCGAAPWLMDIKADDWCLDPDMVRSELAAKTKVKDGKRIHLDTGWRVAAIMPVYTLGNLPDMDKFRQIADEYKLSLIADAACAIGATYHAQPLGSLADASVISFNGNKTVTCGGGGMVVGDGKGLLSRIRHLTATARLGTEYDFDMVGFNYRMTNIQAAVGCAQMERLDEFIAVKKYVRMYYAGRLQELNIRFFPTAEGSSCWFSGIVLPSGKSLEEVRAVITMLKEKGIEARTFWKPVHLQDAYLDVPKSFLVTAENLWQRIITLPCSTNITDEELDWVVRCVKQVIK